MTKYSSHHSLEKQKSRNKIYDEVVAMKGRPINVLTLPSTNFILERELVKIKNVSLTCVERERSIYQSVLGKSCTSEYYLGDVFEYLQSAGKTFDVIWLDLCCYLSLDIIRKFLRLLQSESLSKQGVVALTVMGSREHEANILPHVFDCKTVEEFRLKGFPELVIHHGEDNGRAIKMKELYHYTSRPLPLNMNMYLFTPKTTKS